MEQSKNNGPEVGPKSPEELQLDAARLKYAGAYKAFLAERKENTGMAKNAWRSVWGSNIPESEIPPNLKQLEQEYNQAAIACGQSMFEDKKKQLEGNSTLSAEQRTDELRRFKQKDIFDRIIVQEQEALNNLKAENLPPREKAAWKKGVEWYLKQPMPVKVATSFVLSGAFAMFVMPSSIAAAGGAAAYWGIKAGRTALGMSVLKIYDLISPEKLSAEVREAQKKALSEMFSEKTGDIDVASAKKDYARILEEEKKAKINRLIKKAVISAGINIGAGIAAADLINGTSSPSITPSTGNETSAEIERLTQEKIDKQKLIDTLKEYSTERDESMAPVYSNVMWGIKISDGMSPKEAHEISEHILDLNGTDDQKARTLLQMFGNLKDSNGNKISDIISELKNIKAQPFPQGADIKIEPSIDNTPQDTNNIPVPEIKPVKVQPFPQGADIKIEPSIERPKADPFFDFGKTKPLIFAPIEDTPTGTFHEVSTSLENGEGGIQGVLDLQKQIKIQYPDISKAPQSVQDFMNTDATKKAIELGFYDPNNVNESALIPTGSILKFDEQGNLLFGKPDASGNIPALEKFEGRMLDTDKPVTTPEPTPSPATPEPITPAKPTAEELKAILEAKYSKNGPLFNDYEKPSYDKNIGTGTSPKIQEVSPAQIPNAETARILQSHPEFVINNPYVLSTQQLTETYNVHFQNIKHLLPNDTIESWHNIGRLEAKDLLRARVAIEEPKGPMSSIVSYAQRLQAESGLKPQGGLLVREETFEHYEARALQKIASEGNLEKMRLHTPVPKSPTFNQIQQILEPEIKPTLNRDFK